MSTSKMSQQATSAVRAAAHSMRNVHSSSAARATAVMDTPPLTIPPIFDIFDVPVTLRASRTFTLEHAKKPRAPSSASTSSSSQHSPLMPTSLPNPLVFEGPAGRRPVVRTHHELTQQRSVSYAPQGVAPVVTMFDGPAHSGGRQWQGPQRSTPPNGRNIQLAMGAAAATALTFGVVNS
ncbi:hypothetical protein C8R44DRAFT_990595 [Mycena epipterygia]|nr:hypothetical protein C8R44DRAFT_990595 [Mycena epipterygia]